MRKLICVFVLGAVLDARLSLADEVSPLELGRSYSTMFYEEDISAIWASMTDRMHDALESETALREFRRKVGSQIGSETSIVNERVEHVSGYRVYLRHALFEKIERPVVMSWTFDDEDRIAGFYVRPQQEPAKSPYLDYQTQADLRLPFSGEWYVFWGGRSVADNYHAAATDQRFAYDMLVVNDGKSHAGDGTSNAQYHCWSKAILAPAGGTVVAARDGLPDNPPGEVDPRNPPGNHVVLNLGNSEFALLAHLQRGSVAVEKGDRVAAGDQIGRCGNSGNTTEPHLHFHLQDKPKFGKGHGKPALFRGYLSNGTPVERGEPKRGEFVQNIPIGDND